MANPDDTDLLSGFPEERKSLDDISWLVLKVNKFIPSAENTGQVNAQYEIREAQKDSFDYLGIDMDYISGEWKVTNFYVEK
jgi:MoxR-like ATPase